MEEHNSTEPKRPYNSYVKYSGFAFQLLGGLGFGGWAGHELDLILGFEFPVFMLSFILVILSGMLYQMYRKLNQD